MFPTSASIRSLLMADTDRQAPATPFGPEVDGDRGRRLSLLWEVAQLLLTANDPADMVRTVFQRICEELDVDTYLMFVASDSLDAMQLASCDGIGKDEAAEIQRIELGADPKAQLVKRCGIRAYACNPLLCADRLLGTLSFASHTRDEFTDDDLDVFRIVSHDIAVAYDRLRLIAQLREADRRKDEFLAALAHELRNPLAPIRSAVDFLRLKRSEDADRRAAQDIIDRQAGHMTRLVDDLLDVSRVALGRVELTITRATIGFVLGNALEVSRPLIEDKRHDLILDLPPEPLYVDVDVTRLAQVFVNLFNNAAKYTPAGGTIRVTATEELDRVVVRVRDNGIGIPAHLLSAVFELFRRADGPLVRDVNGLGIGLTLAQRLAELHGGDIEAISEGENHGSEFIVRLPRAVAPVATG